MKIQAIDLNDISEKLLQEIVAEADPAFRRLLIADYQVFCDTMKVAIELNLPSVPCKLTE